jgi:hypothetical protein
VVCGHYKKLCRKKTLVVMETERMGLTTAMIPALAGGFGYALATSLSAIWTTTTRGFAQPPSLGGTSYVDYITQTIQKDGELEQSGGREREEWKREEPSRTGLLR